MVNYVQWLGLLGFSLFTLGGWLGTALMNSGLLLLLIAGVFEYRAIKLLLVSDPILYLVGIGILYLILRTTVGHYEFPELASAQWRDTKALVLLGLFPLIGIWLYWYPHWIRYGLVLATLGLLLKIAIALDWHQPLTSYQKLRDLNLGLTIIAAGLYLGALLLWWIALSDTLIQESHNAIYQWIMIILLSILILSLAQGLIATQSRGALLGFILGLVSTLLFNLWCSGRKRWYLYRFVGIGAILFVGIILANSELLLTRLTAQADSYLTIMTFDLAKIPHTVDDAIGVRIHLWVFGIEQWLQRPLWGWGVGLVQPLLESHPFLNELRHLHNSYLQIIVEVGLIGFSMVAAIAYQLARQVWRAYRQQQVPYDLVAGLLGVWLLTMVWSLTNTRLTHADERFFLLFMLAITYGTYLKARSYPQKTV